MKSENIELVDKMKILGTVVKSDLTWSENCDPDHKESQCTHAVTTECAQIWCQYRGDGQCSVEVCWSSRVWSALKVSKYC